VLKLTHDLKRLKSGRSGAARPLRLRLLGAGSAQSCEACVRRRRRAIRDFFRTSESADDNIAVRRRIRQNLGKQNNEHYF